MGEKQEELRDELVPDTAPGEEEDFALDSFDMLRVIGTGTFARVCLCQVSIPILSSRIWNTFSLLFVQDKRTKCYYAMKILTMSQVIKLKQVEHVINEKEILRWLF